jgi:fibronectin type 3 domain-containing protein
MKKSTLILLAIASVVLTNCGDAIKGLMIYDKDPTLQSIQNVKALPLMNSVGFEWQKINNPAIHGINVYRGTPSKGTQSLKKIGTIGNRYATHFVDTHVKPNHTYLYTFTTFSFGRESRHGKVLHVKTPPAFKPVSFVKAYRVAPTVIKLLWRPHPYPAVNRYVIERSVGGGDWHYLAQVEGQLMVEYIDTYVHPGRRYAYRVIAKSFDGITAKPSPVTTISL